MLFSVFKNLLGGDIVIVYLGKDNSKGMFKIGDCEVLIMPFMYNPDSTCELIDITDRLQS